MGGQDRFYSNEEEWQAFTEQLKLIACPHCKVLRKARNLSVGCMIEAVRSGSKTIDIDIVNRVLMQPHWQKDADLVDY